VEGQPVQREHDRLVRILLALVLVLAGCGSVAPSPSLTASAASSAQTTTRPSASPTSRATESPTQPPQDGVTDLALDVQRVPDALTGHVSAFASLGDQIVWGGGRGRADNNLYRYVPGADEAELLYLNTEPNSSITSVAGSAAGYVFTDDRWVDGEPRGWRLWFLPAEGDEPVEMDRSADDRLISPTIAMNDRWIAWEVVHGTFEEPVNELRVASVADPLAPVTLLAYPGRDLYMQFPALWEDELWYGIADNDWAALTEKPRVEMLDLTHLAATPVAFGAGQRAFMPAPGNDVVAWKGGGTDEFAALSSGMLMLYWRSDGQIDELPLPGRETAAERISYPSVGNRFVAWWDDIAQRFYVYDLVERRFRRIAEYDWTGEEGVTKPSISGDLLVYTHYLSDGERYLEWARLPR
jgi:hypothetical protein